MSTKILLVDDDAQILNGLQRKLRKDFVCDIAIGGEQGLRMIQTHGPYAVVMADMQMPNMNGIEFLVQVEAKAPDTVRMMLTGNADQKTSVDAVNQGHVFRFLTKPADAQTLTQTLNAGLRQYQLITAERQLLEKTLNGSITVLTDILAMLDPRSFSHAQHLREYMTACAQAFKISRPWELEMAATLSQIGCVTIPTGVLEKARSGQTLSVRESELLGRVSEVGFHLLSKIPRLETVANIVRYQSKNFDGSGFPVDNVAGGSIPIGARILRVLSDLVLIEGQGMTKEQALVKMRQHTGLYDATVLDFVGSAFDVFIPNLSNAYDPGHPVMFNELRVGQILRSDVVTEDDVKIVMAGTEITSVLLEKLRNFASLSGIRDPILVAG